MNVWKQFEQLQRGTVLRVGTVTATFGQESEIQDAGGSTYRALGTSVAVGEMAFVKDGVVIGSAPSLTDAGVVYV